MAEAKTFSRGMGFRRQLQDHRDFRMAARPETIAALPKKVDLSRYDSPIKDQGLYSCCTGMALTELFEWYENFKTGTYTPGSPMYNYWYSRKLENIVGDNGSTLRAACKVLGVDGVPPEKAWPFIAKNLINVPTPAVKKLAMKSEARKYYLLDGATNAQTLNNIKVTLQTLPVAIGFTCYNSVFTPPKSGIIALPKKNEAYIGGHAVESPGYNDYFAALLARNSWSVKYALKGYFYIPYWYILNGLVSDIWVVPAESQIDSLTETHVLSEGATTFSAAGL
jgi:C1A family cysteine protease